MHSAGLLKRSPTYSSTQCDLLNSMWTSFPSAPKVHWHSLALLRPQLVGLIGQLNCHNILLCR